MCKDDQTAGVLLCRKQPVQLAIADNHVNGNIRHVVKLRAPASIPFDPSQDALALLPVRPQGAPSDGATT
jgi:hypothetical protein